MGGRCSLGLVAPVEHGGLCLPRRAVAELPAAEGSGAWRRRCRMKAQRLRPQSGPYWVVARVERGSGLERTARYQNRNSFRNESNCSVQYICVPSASKREPRRSNDEPTPIDQRHRPTQHIHKARFDSEPVASARQQVAFSRFFCCPQGSVCGSVWRWAYVSLGS